MLAGRTASTGNSACVDDPVPEELWAEVVKVTMALTRSPAHVRASTRLSIGESVVRGGTGASVRGAAIDVHRIGIPGNNDSRGRPHQLGAFLAFGFGQGGRRTDYGSASFGEDRYGEDRYEVS